MLKQETISLFDPNRIRLGDVVRYSRLGSHKKPRLALVQRVSPERLTVTYCNQQTGKVSYQNLTAQDVSVGIYALEWSHDLHQVYQVETGLEPESDLESDLEEEEDLDEDLEEELEEDLEVEVPQGENAEENLEGEP